MFIELTAKALNEKWTINIKSVAFFYPIDNGTRIFFISDDTPLEVKEDYKTVKRMINKKRYKL